MSKKLKLKPLVGVLSVLDPKTNEKATLGEITITPTHNDGENFWGLGHVIGGDGRPSVTVNFSSTPIRVFPFEQTGPVGRPPDEDKKIAVMCAWALACNRLGNKRSLADDEVAKSFGYSEGSKVRRLRPTEKKRIELPSFINPGKTFSLGIDDVLDVRDPHSNDKDGAVVLMEQPSITRYEKRGLDFVSSGLAWYEQRPSVIERGVVSMTVGDLNSQAEVEKMLNWQGPILVSIIGTGPK